MRTIEQRFQKRIGQAWNVGGYRYSLWTETEPEDQADGLAYWLVQVEISSCLRRRDAILDLKYGRKQRLPEWMQPDSSEFTSAPKTVQKVLKRFQ